MPGRRCERCGRTQPPWGENEAIRSRPRIEFGAAEEDPLFNLLGRPWASIDGKDVCPQCQFATERRDVTRRIVSAIEDQIKRSDAEGTEPSAIEPALVPYAMQLREALSSNEASDSTTDSQREPEANSPQPGRILLDVAITGAFLTGCPLRIAIADYQEVQRTLVTNLSGNAGAGWQTAGDESRVGTYQSGGGFSSVLPLVVATRHGADTLARAGKIFNDQPEGELEWLDRHIEGWAVKATSMQVDVYDLGVAVINGTFRVGLPAHLTLSAAAAALKKMVWLRSDAEDDGSSPITGMFRTLSEETTSQFRASVEAAVRDRAQPAWLSQSTLKPSDEWGRLLWLHPVHMLECADPATRRWSARELAPPFHKTVTVPDGQLVSGIGWSAIVTDGDRSAFALPMKLVQLHWAYYALYMEIDRGLLIVLDQNKSSTKGSTLPQLERDAERVFDDYIRVMKARARVDSALASLGGGEQAIWDAIADVQEFEALVGGVDRKVDALQRIAERRVQQATSAAASRSAMILGFLTTLTLVTLATTLLAYFFGGFSAPHNDPQPPLRWLFLIVGAVLAVILWYFTFWRPRRKKRREVPQWAE